MKTVRCAWLYLLDQPRRRNYNLAILMCQMEGLRRLQETV